MIKKRFIIAGMIIAIVMGLAMYCNNSTSVTPKNGLFGTWSGGAGKQGGGGIGNLDSFGVAISIYDKGYSMVRGNKIWGSSLFSRDSTRDAGTWATAADSVIFTPDTAHDSCCQKPGITNPNGWVKCLGYNTKPEYCECYPPLHLKIDTSGNTWHTAVIPNSKDPNAFDTFELIKQ